MLKNIYFVNSNLNMCRIVLCKGSTSLILDNLIHFDLPLFFKEIGIIWNILVYNLNWILVHYFEQNLRNVIVTAVMFVLSHLLCGFSSQKKYDNVYSLKQSEQLLTIPSTLHTCIKTSRQKQEKKTANLTWWKTKYQHHIVALLFIYIFRLFKYSELLTLYVCVCM